MKCLLLHHKELTPALRRWLENQTGVWTTVAYDAYVDTTSEVIKVVSDCLDEIDATYDLASFDRVLFIPPGYSVAVLPFFDELCKRLREGVVPEQLNMIRGPGGLYEPCPEYPLYRTVFA